MSQLVLVVMPGATLQGTVAVLKAVMLPLLEGWVRNWGEESS